MKNEKTRVVIAASGTGGHLFPAVYIAEAFKKAVPDLDLVFIGSGRPLEEKILGGRGFELLTIPTYGVKNLGPVGFIKFAFHLPFALLKTLSIFRRIRPQVVIGVGGYVTVVPIIVARLFGIPTWVHEAELRPGLANQLLKFFASRISVAFKEASLAKDPKATYTGHPVRQELRQITPGLALGHNPRKILVLGGSQGASALDEALPRVLENFKSNGIEVRHQCREVNAEAVSAAYVSAGIEARVQPFIERMAAAYSWADIIIARSGAGTVMEIGLTNRPTIFVPYPHAQGDHQTANAQTLVGAGKALLVKEGEGFEERLRECLNRILEPETYFAMKLAKYETRSLDAADKITAGCLELMHKSK